MISRNHLIDFLIESNKIESILGPPTGAEVESAMGFLRFDNITVDDLMQLVLVLQPNAKLRMEVGLDVFVGDHVPPPGSPHIQEKLDDILLTANQIGAYPYELHKAYENLHPFTDGNGRSGRLLWLWMMGDKYDPRLGFLHSWYYASLKAHR